VADVLDVVLNQTFRLEEEDELPRVYAYFQDIDERKRSAVVRQKGFMCKAGTT
jgi:hypothetical protein